MKLNFILFFVVFKVSCFCQKMDSTYIFYFASNTSTLSSEEIFKFQIFWKQFENCKNCVLSLEGHTDKVGTETSNYILAQNRIDFVKSLLVNANQFQIINLAFGEQFSQSAIDNQLFRKVNLQLKCNINEVEISKEVKVEKQISRFEEFNARGKAITLNILFYPGITAFLPESTKDLELLYSYLNENLTVKATIIGHVCCSPEYNLSQNRAFVVYDYLISKGIDKKRLSHEGRSNREPKVKEINEASQKINRRVEVVFLE